MNVGSFAGDLPPPRLAIYGASKRFVEYLARGLSMDERYFTATNVQFMYISVGQVSTNALKRPTSFLCPDADTFAKAVVGKIGCNKRRITPYVGHAMSQWVVDMLGVSLGETIVAQSMKQMFFSEGRKVE